MKLNKLHETEQNRCREGVGTKVAQMWAACPVRDSLPGAVFLVAGSTWRIYEIIEEGTRHCKNIETFDKTDPRSRGKMSAFYKTDARHCRNKNHILYDGCATPRRKSANFMRRVPESAEEPQRASASHKKNARRAPKSSS